MDNRDGNEQLKYSASVRLDDDRAARIASLQVEVDRLTARSAAVERQLSMARAVFDRLKDAFVLQHGVIEQQRSRIADQQQQIEGLRDQVSQLRDQVSHLREQVSHLQARAADDQANLELQRIEVQRLIAELNALIRNRDTLEIELRARQAELAAIVHSRGYRALEFARRVVSKVRNPNGRSAPRSAPEDPPEAKEAEGARVSTVAVVPLAPPTEADDGRVDPPAETPAPADASGVPAPAPEGEFRTEVGLCSLEAAPPPVEAFLWPDLDLGALPPARQEVPSGAAEYRARVRRHAFVVLPIIDWDFRFQRPQQLARELAAEGHPVFYVRMAFSRVAKRRELHPGVIELALPGPTSLDPYRDSLDRELARRLARVIALELRRDAVGCAVTLAQLPFWTPLALSLRDLLGMPVLYDCMDEHAGFSTNSAAMLAEENRLVLAADVVVASSSRLRARLAQQKDDVVLIRNAADVSHFAGVAPPPSEPGRPMNVGYYGAIADWFDSELLARVARLRPEWNFTLVGNTATADLAPLSHLPNVRLTGEQPYSVLPEWLAQWDVCVIPFKITPLTAATDPVKVYEMLAAGRPVVATAMDELKELAQRGLVRIAASADEMVAQLEAARAGDDDVQRAIRRDFAVDNSWSRRRDDLVHASRRPFPLVSIVVVTYNNLELNRLCVESVLNDTDYPNIELVLVDNASVDGTPEFLRDVAQRDPRVRLVLNRENRGFAGGNNDGVAASRGNIVCLLNNDTVVTGAWLSALVRHLLGDTRLGLVGPVTNAISNEARIDVGYEYVTDMPAWSDSYSSMHSGELADVPMLAFFCVAMRRAVWDDVGPLDEGFRTGMFEDDDWNRRAREKGYRVALARDSFVHHWHNASLNRLSTPAYRRIYFENRRYYRLKWGEAPKPDAAAEALVQRIVESARRGQGAAYFPASVGAPARQRRRLEQIRRAFDRIGLTQIVEVPAPADEPALNCFHFSGEREWLAEVPGLFLVTDSSNFDARDVLPPDVPCVFDWVDYCEHFAGDLDRTRWLQWRGVKEAEVLSTPDLDLRRIAAQHRDSVLYLPDARERFQSPAPAPNDDPDWLSVRSNPAPVAAFCGPLVRAVDFALIAALADLRPDWQFVLIGPDVDGSVWHADLDRRFNVRWLDRATPEHYAWHADVVLLPWRSNETIPPPDVLDLLHAGVPVVACPHGQVDVTSGVQRAEDAAGFSAALSQLRAQLGTKELSDSLQSAASGYDWHRVASRLLDALSPQLKRDA